MIQSRPQAENRILMIGGDQALRASVRDRYPDFDVAWINSTLSGISDVCRHRCRGVLAYVEETAERVTQQVAGLREAVGTDGPLILCCKPEVEPIARRALQAGATDYLVCPLDGAELDHALGIARPDEWPGEPPAAPSAGMDELDGLGALLRDLPAEGRTFATRLAEWVKGAMGSPSVRLVVEGTVTEVGQVGAEPVLVEPIQVGSELLGQISLDVRPGRPYGRADSEKLRHYAALAGQLLRAAKAQRRWCELALTDELSELPNRRRLLGFLKDVLPRADRERFCVTLLLFDIDDFKRYNDVCGHDAGDEIIRVVGRLIREHCREDDLVARYGGDEFAVVFWDAEQPRVVGSQHPDDAMVVLRRFTEALGAQELAALKQHGPYQLTISGGLATFPWDGRTADQLITRADAALMQAKKAGKNRIFHIGDSPSG